MTPAQQVQSVICANESKLVVFDLDDTLIKGNTFSYWATYLTEKGWIHRRTWKLKEKWMLFQYSLGLLNFDGFIKATVAPYQDWDPALRDERIQACIERYLTPALYHEGVLVIRELQKKGIPIMVLTASNALFVRPFLRQTLGLTYVAATELETRPDGRLTGRVSGTPPYQQGKIEVLQPYLHHFGVSWHEVAFLTDSINDMPLLERVGTPIAVNPDKRLRQEAKRRQWLTLDWME